uniref:Egal-1 winged helix domain-containing protein n=1 Tax=Panagrolaimus davidi TaxID=227884 RepID=A0A914QMU4_9BILA
MDDAKHMALLFFVDHLLQKNGIRTISDLRCQFGARWFSPEMREAVGTTQKGLIDFLQSHPSLFTVEGDQEEKVSDALTSSTLTTPPLSSNSSFVFGTDSGHSKST